MQEVRPLRPFQKRAIETLLGFQGINGLGKKENQPRHLLLQSPTGSGKSRVFEEWIRAKKDERFLLISPLVALMDQQVENLNALGIKAKREFSRKNQLNCHTLVVAPESLFQKELNGSFKIKKWVLEFSPQNIIIDECHCVWMWGESFRPEYREIFQILKLPSVRCSLWLSATVTASFRKALQDELNQLNHDLEIQGGFSLPENLGLSFEKVPYTLRMDRLQFQLSVFRQMKTQTLVFVNTRRTAEYLSRALKIASGKVSELDLFEKRNTPAQRSTEKISDDFSEFSYFHAGLSLEEKQNLLIKLKQGEISTVICTSAFGMGLDLPFLDNVILWQLPFSILDLAQRLGRAGRGQRQGKGIVFWDEEDFLLLGSFFENYPQKKAEILEEMRGLVSERVNPRENILRHF